MIRRAWQTLGRLLHALDGCANPQYRPVEITEDPDALGYSGAAPDFGPAEAEPAWDEGEFQRWLADLRP